ncbi:unnamed protein product [Boreogadus saida]
MPKRSKVWLHFAQVDTNRARCSICQKVVLAKDGNTSNLAKHLIMHKINLRSDSCSVFHCKAKKAKKDDGTSSPERLLLPHRILYRLVTGIQLGVWPTTLQACQSTQSFWMLRPDGTAYI